MLDKELKSIVNKLDSIIKEHDNFESKVDQSNVTKEQKIFLIDAMKKARKGELDIKQFSELVKEWQ